ncbi:MAG TPA: hypothetical protein VGN16_09395 [Acidobacteriaceae bacterium]|jgi:hypothetical protein
MHNKVASTVSLAKTVRMALDHSKEHSALPTRTLELILNTFIELAEQDNPTARNVQGAHSNFVVSRTTGAEGRR